MFQNHRHNLTCIDFEHTSKLKEQYKCPHFRILIIGRANAGKTTILEKVCGVAQGTKPIIYDHNGELLVKVQALIFSKCSCATATFCNTLDSIN